jgi:hypothetical protein
MITRLLPDEADDCLIADEVTFVVTRMMGLTWRHYPIVIMT